MHTNFAQDAGSSIQVHHNSDWSGDVIVHITGLDDEHTCEGRVPGNLFLALCQKVVVAQEEEEDIARAERGEPEEQDDENESRDVCSLCKGKGYKEDLHVHHDEVVMEKCKNCGGTGCIRGLDPKVQPKEEPKFTVLGVDAFKDKVTHAHNAGYNFKVVEGDDSTLRVVTVKREQTTDYFLPTGGAIDKIELVTAKDLPTNTVEPKAESNSSYEELSLSISTVIDNVARGTKPFQARLIRGPSNTGALIVVEEEEFREIMSSMVSHSIVLNDIRKHSYKTVTMNPNAKVDPDDIAALPKMGHTVSLVLEGVQQAGTVRDVDQMRKNKGVCYVRVESIGGEHVHCWPNELTRNMH